MKLLKKITCTLLTAILLNASISTPVFAAEATDIIMLEASTTGYNTFVSEGIDSRSTTFVNASVDIAFDSAGMNVWITTGVAKTASVIGVKDIKVQKKGIFGIWTTVATLDGEEDYNIGNCTVSFIYTGAVEGETYRVCCTHYADVDGYRELEHETNGVRCSY